MKPLARRCIAPGCPNETSGRRCAEHEAERGSERRERSPHHAVYKTAAWAKLRAQVLREEPRCRRCGAPSEHVDHIVPIRAGGAPLERSNCQGLCHADHSRKTLEEGRSR